ncbi:MAG: hypothetical protein AMS23_06650 [Bacteroides sp. SM1_62]|nr:MAG: hypothetical protein AMS26_08660 [Bacteroides sp. SM23_62]KPL23414.1 MAG: hypothetical protein AMS23_06650 [Bacteroides sp. SM1_62]
MKPTRKPQGRTSDVQSNMYERAIPAPANEASADPSEIFCFVFILFNFQLITGLAWILHIMPALR